MKILVSGANGFIGRALCSHLSLLGHEVVPVVRSICGIKNEQIICNNSSWISVLRGCDTVIHLAGLTYVVKKEKIYSEKIFQTVNVNLTLELARQAVQAGVGRFIFMSTIKVNGESTDLGCSFSSDSPTKPQDLYAKSKWEAEQGLKLISKNAGLDVVIIRPPIVYGPGVKGNFHLLIQLIKLGIPLPLGGLVNLRSMIALDNLVSFISLCADVSASPDAKNEVFLIADSPAISTSELMCKISEAYEANLRLFSIPIGILRFFALCIGKYTLIERLTDCLLIDDTKTRNLLGWVPLVSIDEQLRKMANAANS